MRLAIKAVMIWVRGNTFHRKDIHRNFWRIAIIIILIIAASSDSWGPSKTTTLESTETEMLQLKWLTEKLVWQLISIEFLNIFLYFALLLCFGLCACRCKYKVILFHYVVIHKHFCKKPHSLKVHWLWTWLVSLNNFWKGGSAEHVCASCMPQFQAVLEEMSFKCFTKKIQNAEPPIWWPPWVLETYFSLWGATDMNQVVWLHHTTEVTIIVTQRRVWETHPGIGPMLLKFADSSYSTAMWLISTILTGPALTLTLYKPAKLSIPVDIIALGVQKWQNKKVKK